MSRFYLQCLFAVLLAFGTAVPGSFLSLFDEIGIVHADDDDNDDDDDNRPMQPREQAVRPPPKIQSTSIQPTPSVRAAHKSQPLPRKKQHPVAPRYSLQNPTFESGEVLAVDPSPDLLDRAKSLGFTVGRSVSLPGLGLRITRLRIPARLSPSQALSFLKRQIPGGNFVLNHIYRVNAEPCRDGRCYGSVLIGWQDSEQCGSGIKLGMVDTAADRRHPALEGQKVVTRAFADGNRASSTLHGTAVAALLVGSLKSDFPGLLPQAELYAADTFTGSEPQNLRTNVFLLAQGFDWLLGQGVSVVNTSLTGPDNALLQTTIQRLQQHRVVVVAAAGNGGPKAPSAFPAAYPEAIAVTAIDRLLRPYRLANRGDYVTIAAPGVRIWTPSSKGGQYSDGTSFAAPYVTAVVAQLHHRQPHAIPADLKAQIQQTARDLGAVGKDAVFGWGLVQSTNRCD